MVTYYRRRNCQMKRVLSFVLILSLCFGLTSVALADTTASSTILMPQGGTQWGTYVTTWASVPGNPPPTPRGPVARSRTALTDQQWRTKAHSHMKSYAKNIIEMLKRELETINWSYKTIKSGPVWSYETRIIMGANGDNKHQSKLRPITFYYKDNPDIKVEAYMVVAPAESWKVYRDDGTRDYNVIFVTNFIGGQKRPYTYNEKWMLTSEDQDGMAAVMELVNYLESLSNASGI